MKSKTGGYFGLSSGLAKKSAANPKMAMPKKSAQMNDELSANLFNA
jgi:hypothetical protein